MSKESLARVVCCALPLLAGGCVVMTPSPVLSAVELASTAATHAASLAPSSPANAVTHGYDRFPAVCIEFNRALAIADFVPALQAELVAQKVESRVYETVMPGECRYSLHYSGDVRWGRRLFSDAYAPYLAGANLELRDGGRLLASASYTPSLLGQDRWASTRSKLAPAVRVMVHGNVEGRAP
ncbi:MAG: hypothetical protein REI09_05750 [Candidatus Dactylopiibacterium sp.]|nr:hypothetical protein [Candidatus Dactylopiibacterium sp.]